MVRECDWDDELDKTVMAEATATPESIARSRKAAGRERIAAAVAVLAQAIDRGDVTPVLEELEAAVAVCEEHDLPIEAARIRRWLGMDMKGRA